ncbi:MAG: DUF4267 domain-containing protein [Hyphomicrobium sp.]
MRLSMKTVRMLALGGGVLLSVIGIRFLVVPEQAARTFGLAKDLVGTELHDVIALRDLWLGLLAIALAWLKEWRALALWFGFGAGVCFGDAMIAATSGGRPAPVLFHMICGLACAVLARASWYFGASPDRGDDTA